MHRNSKNVSVEAGHYSEELQEEEQNCICTMAVLMENMSVKEENQEVIVTKMVISLQSIKTSLQQKEAQNRHTKELISAQNM